MFNRLVSLIILGINLGCSISAEIVVVDSIPASSVPVPVEAPPTRASPDFVNGQVVTTSNGTKIRAAFGEISEKRILSNGIKIEGVFYE